MPKESIEAVKQISVYIPPSYKEAKRKLGISWRSLIGRGIDSASKQSQERVNELKEANVKLSTKLQALSVRLFNLENKE